ncbi:MAG: hypothetical protein CM1200mP30_25930 [Pseudomonadota bacterium]|nr:MAG: hypothetical protein CM1200mP30_25930 [Pseudomonadota bacterium]
MIAFQTRNPMHRAHEELCRIAQKQLNPDGTLGTYAAGQAKRKGTYQLIYETLQFEKW